MGCLKGWSIDKFLLVFFELAVNIIKCNILLETLLFECILIPKNGESTARVCNGFSPRFAMIRSTDFASSNAAANLVLKKDSVSVISEVTTTVSKF